MTIEQQAINQTTWSQAFGFHQGIVVSGPTRTLYISGQTSVDADGRPVHDGDMAAQVAQSIHNMEAVLHGADMTLSNLVRLNVFTTDVDALLPHYGVLAARLGAAGVSPTTTMVQVTRLAISGQMIELEGTAVA